VADQGHREKDMPRAASCPRWKAATTSAPWGAASRPIFAFLPTCEHERASTHRKARRTGAQSRSP
jgi:hypothetical protein